jgi:hypothetical protein
MLIKKYLGKIGIFDRAVVVMVSPLPISLFLFFDLFSFCHNVNFLVDRIIVSLMQVNLFRHSFQILQNIDVIFGFSSFDLFRGAIFIPCKDILNYSKSGQKILRSTGKGGFLSFF